MGEKNGRSCSTGQSPQRAVVPVEEEEKEEEEEEEDMSFRTTSSHLDLDFPTGLYCEISR
jgi:hypothetical protein